MTSVELEKKDKKTFKLDESENQRINKILQKAVDKETGKLSEDDDSLTEDNPDGRKSNVSWQINLGSILSLFCLSQF